MELPARDILPLILRHRDLEVDDKNMGLTFRFFSQMLNVISIINAGTVAGDLTMSNEIGSNF